MIEVSQRSNDRCEPETLTASERYTVEMLSGRLAGAGCLGKLLRLYDAALARAEAAEGPTPNELICMPKDFYVRGYAFWEKQFRAAESRLAEATALLVRIEKYAREDRASTGKTTRLARVLDETRAFLSATPATAAPSLEQGLVGALLRVLDRYAGCPAEDCSGAWRTARGLLGGYRTQLALLSSAPAPAAMTETVEWTP